MVIVLEGDFQTRADLRAAGNFRDDLKAFYLARSAVSAGEAILKEDFRLSSRYDGLDELWAYPIPEYPLGDGTLTGAIVDEAGKFNLNSLVDDQGRSAEAHKAKRERLGRLFELLQIDRNLVDAIVDWIDKDGEPRPFGAEEESYRRLNPPYSCKNAPLDTLEELHMIKGITDEVYKKISPYLTVYGERNGLININTADRLLIQSLDERIDEAMARRVVESRPFQEITKSRDPLSEGVYNTIKGDIAITSKFFTITTEGRVQDTRKVAHAVVKREGSKTQLLYFKIE